MKSPQVLAATVRRPSSFVLRLQKKLKFRPIYGIIALSLGMIGFDGGG
jgi:hypothetical protein